MKGAKFFVLVLLCCVLNTTLYAGVFDHYLVPFRNAMGNCRIDYKMKCTYPDGNVVHVEGVMALKGSNYYDSSNTRHVLLNDSWYIIADHVERQLSVAYVKNLKMGIKETGVFNVSSFLLGGNAEDIIIKIAKKNADTMWVNLRTADNIVEDMTVVVLSKTLVPVSYTARINYPMGADYEMADGTVASGVIKLDINCFNIHTPVDDGIFDASFIVSKIGNKASMKKYKNYTIIN